MLNLASFGPDDHQLLMQAGHRRPARHPRPSISTPSASGSRRGATELKLDVPADLTISGWWEQARTLED